MPVGMQVTVTGGTPEKRELVTNVMARGLVEQGFSNVALVNTIGEPMVGSNVPSLMDTIRDHHPDFLQTPIRIWSIEPTDPLQVPGPNDEIERDGGGGMALAVVDENEDEIVTSIMVKEPPGGLRAPALRQEDFVMEKPISVSDEIKNVERVAGVEGASVVITEEPPK